MVAMMKVALSFAAVLLLCSAHSPRSETMNHPFAQSLLKELVQEKKAPSLTYTDFRQHDDPATISAWRPPRACDRSATLNEKDTISQKFYDDHICLVRGISPKDLTAFCDEFRPGLPQYQVMILSLADLRRLRSDILWHQDEFKKYKAHFPPTRPPPSTMHFYTQDTYNFIECKKTRKSTYKGKRLSGRYQQYIPRGTPSGIYQIYHGCPPVTKSERQDFSAKGPC